MQIYERNIHSLVKRVSKTHIVTEASLLDLNHSMTVSLKINVNTRTIEEAKGETSKTPFAICQETLKKMKSLEWLKIARGVNKKLIHELAQADGCTHLYELALMAVRLSFNVMIGLNMDWN